MARADPFLAGERPEPERVLQTARHSTETLVFLAKTLPGCRNKSHEGVEDDSPTVKVAPPVVQLIPKSKATEGLLAHVVVSKFADGLPLYRQQKIFARHGIDDISRATLAGWVIQASGKCLPILELIANEIRGGTLINIDESPFQVLKEPGRNNTTKSYMWVFCGGLDRKTVMYRYHPTHSGQVPYAYLRYIFEKLPLAQSTEDYEALLPWNLDSATVIAAARQ